MAKNIIIDCKTWTSITNTKLKRTSVSIDAYMWELGCAQAGSAKELREFIRISAMNGPWDSATAQRAILNLIAKPTLIKRVESDLELQTDIEDV